MKTAPRRTPLSIRPSRTDAQASAGGLVSGLSESDGRRVEFDRLHVLSTRLMMLNLAGAVVLLYWEAREK